MGIIRQQLEAQRTGDWSKLKKRIEAGMLVDVDKFRRILHLKLPEQGKENVLEAIKLLIEREDILYAGPDYFIEHCALPEPSPDYLDYQMSALTSISLPEAWDIVIGSSDLKIGILDTGVQADHPALSDRIDHDLSRDFTTGDETGMVAPYGLQDPSGLGTHVAGIIGANGTSVTGVCWGISLVSLRVLNTFGNGQYSYVQYAVEFATDNLIPILNLSAGGTGTGVGLELNDLYYSIWNYPGLFVCSAGNNGSLDNDANPYYPANWTAELDNLISVGNIDNNDDRYYSSHYGATTVDLFAPGVNIYSTYNYSGYRALNGTSFAAPYVTGVAALVKSLHMEMTPAEIKNVIKASAEDVPALNGLCITGGKLNANNAVNHIPIVGSMDIGFDGMGRIGQFYVFEDKTWSVVERGVDAYPVPSYDPLAIFPLMDLVEWEPMPQVITDYFDQNELFLTFPLAIVTPIATPPGEFYISEYYAVHVTSTEAECLYGFGGTIHGSISAGEMRKIRVENRSGGIPYW